ncbi:hypothetical protein V8B55DRAFT_1553329 [Mucor lusitanicus]|uniref:GDP/GTP exchange factor Sec2 N-terminal domain-containing protein n=2 Tax=Mucor circinelloides f. lusitanicus TaxID=29924 RepID=A0A8H4BAC7_MUCCL|nr:hypothetical protein FB192DRAFT_1398717 [Mucor lusitanicus]
MEPTQSETPPRQEKDIAHLYTSLQALGDSNANSEAKFIPLPPSLPMSPSSSSPIIPSKAKPSPLQHQHQQQMDSHAETQDHSDCPCHHILKEDDITMCSLCNNPIPIIQELLAEKAQYEKEIKVLQEQLQTEQRNIEEQLVKIGQLNTRMEQVMGELDDQTANFQALQNDMELLNDKYVDEIERVAEIQHSKDMVESELEDLSRRLFEEANGMVANEKREKYNLEVAQKHLENQLQETRDRLGAEQMQLKELRKRMEDMMEVEKAVMEVPKTPDHIKDITSLLAERMHLLEQKNAHIDTLMLDEFQEFVKTGTAVSLKKIHTIPFMKNCQEEDVEACLRFGPNSRLSARKMNEAIVLNTCFIEESPQGFAEEQAKRAIGELPLKISGAKSMMWERFSSNNQTTVFSGCQACGRNDGTALPYRFRISYFDDWACIDRFCRDRLVAVCEFYVLIRNIRQGLYNNRSIPDLYHEAMRLRLQMFYARMGALPWTLRTSGVDAAVDQEPKVATSESSPLPKSVKTVANEQETRRGSLGDIHNNTTTLSGGPAVAIATTNDDQLNPKPPLTPPLQQSEPDTPKHNNMTTESTDNTNNTDTTTTTTLPTEDSH